MQELLKNKSKVGDKQYLAKTVIIPSKYEFWKNIKYAQNNCDSCHLDFF